MGKLILSSISRTYKTLRIVEPYTTKSFLERCWYEWFFRIIKEKFKQSLITVCNNGLKHVNIVRSVVEAYVAMILHLDGELNCMSSKLKNALTLTDECFIVATKVIFTSSFECTFPRADSLSPGVNDIDETFTLDLLDDDERIVDVSLFDHPLFYDP